MKMKVKKERTKKVLKTKKKSL